MVFRSAECWMDHRLVCATLRLHPVFKKQTSCRQKRFNVGPLYNGEFVQKFVSQLLEDVWDGEAELFARVLNNRLQLVVEETVSDSQCGFRAGRGCVDMIFCVRQLVEKAIEHNNKLFLLFVDLRKAYDSVPRAALWCALQKYGVPDIMIELIRSLYDGMSTTVTVGGGRSEPFSVRNGLRQGCTIAPLFILYFGVVIDRWLNRCQAAGVEVQLKLGGRLVGERTKRPSSFALSECLFADDAALVCSCRGDVVLAARIFDEVATENGLTLSVPKSKLLVAGIGLTNDDLAPLELSISAVAS